MLAAQVQEFFEQLLRGGDDAGAAAVLGGGQDQLDQVLADVAVGEFDGAGGERADAAFAGIAFDRFARVDALAEQVAADLLQDRCCWRSGPCGSGRAGARHRSEHAADQPAFGDREAGERTRRKAVLAGHVHVGDGIARAIGLGEAADLAEIEIEHERRLDRMVDARWWRGRRSGW